MRNKALAIGLMVAVSMFILVMFVGSGIEEGGGRVRMNVIAAGILTPLYLLGGMTAVAAVLAAIAGFLAWLFFSGKEAGGGSTAKVSEHRVLATQAKPAIRFCTKCGKQAGTSDRFCAGCGSQITNGK